MYSTLVADPLKKGYSSARIRNPSMHVYKKEKRRSTPPAADAYIASVAMHVLSGNYIFHWTPSYT